MLESAFLSLQNIHLFQIHPISKWFTKGSSPLPLPVASQAPLWPPQDEQTVMAGKGAGGWQVEKGLLELEAEDSLNKAALSWWNLMQITTKWLALGRGLYTPGCGPLANPRRWGPGSWQTLGSLISLSCWNQGPAQLQCVSFLQIPAGQRIVLLSQHFFLPWGNSRSPCLVLPTTFPARTGRH